MPFGLDGSKGGTFPSWTTAGRPASPVAGQTGYNSTLAILETYNGTTWVPAGGIAGLGPAFRAYRSSNLSVTSTALTLIPFDVVSFDTASAYNAGTSRFTPLVAGYYLVSINVSGAASSALTAVVGSIFKNGTEAARNQIVASLSGATSAPCTTLIFMNGSTDYIQCYGQVNGTTTTITGDAGGTFTNMSICLMRSA